MLGPSWTGLDLIKSNVDSAERLTILTKSVHIPSSVYPLSPFRCVTGLSLLAVFPTGVCLSALMQMQSQYCEVCTRYVKRKLVYCRLHFTA
jgi:hypothetical protein